LAQNAPDAVELMLLLPDGTVMAANQPASDYGSVWYRLTPDNHGNYVNGAWTVLAPMADTRLYYSSAVLRDGRVFVAGGEYGTGTAKAEIYDPQSNIWTQLPTSGQFFSDSVSKVIANGNVLVAPVGPSVSGGTVMFNPAANSWAAGPKLFRGTYEDEASWVKLPDDSILTLDPFGTNSERYIPSLNRWLNDANVPVTLYNSLSELGPAFLLPNGRAFFIGGTSHTALYTPSGTTNAGVWTAGPDIPGGLGVSDGAGAMMSNGKVLCVAGSTTTYNAPTSFFEYDPLANSFTQVNGPTGTTDNVSPYQTAMLDLPDGNVLYSHFGSRLYVYQPGGTPLPAGKPAITSVTLNPDGSYHLTGTLLNGISEGAAYGDDAQMDSNYPLVRMTNSGGNVFYARTYNWSSTGVMKSNQVVTTEFTLPPNLPAGSDSLVVVANGISSDPVAFTPAALAISPATGFTAAGPAGGPFDDSAQDFSLTNAGTTSFTWSLSSTSSWLSASPSAGTLFPGGGSATVHAALAPPASNLLPGTYSATLVFSNQTDHAVQSRQVNLQIPYASFQPYLSTLLALNPVGYWRLDETNQPLSDGTAENLGYIGSDADGAYSGAPAWVTGALQGDTDTAATFLGATAVTVPFISQLSLSPPFTIEAWVQPVTTQPSGGFVCPLACGEFASPRSGWLIYQSATGWNFRLYDQNGLNTSLNIEAGGAPVPGVWYHIAATYDGSVGTIYVNGNGSAPTAADFVPNVDGDLTIGMRSDRAFSFPGSVDEVALYNQVLSASDVLAHYQAGTNTSPATPYDQLVLGQGPMIYFRLDAPGAIPLAANAGTLAGAATGLYEGGVVPGIPGAPPNGLGATNHACLFNGAGFVDIPGKYLNFTGPVTVTAWVKANPANGLLQTLVGKGDTSYRLDMDANGRPGFSDGQQASGELFSTARIDDGQWHQLAGTYDGAHTENLYVDGQLAATTTSATTAVAGGALDLWLGGAPDYGAAHLFSGTLDEAALFNTVLSSNQVRMLYSAAFATPPVFTTVNRSGNSLNLSWSSLTGRTYQVQFRTNLAQSGWSNVGGMVLATNSIATTTDSPGTDRQRFYRVLLEP
jgi:hypothetical protein